MLDRLRQVSGRRRHSDWILYAVFDSIIDMFWTYVQQGIMESSSLDDLVLILSAHEQTDLLRRIGMARRRVMYLRAQLFRKKDLLLALLAKGHIQKKTLTDPCTCNYNMNVNANCLLSCSKSQYQSLFKRRTRSRHYVSLSELLLSHKLTLPRSMLEDVESTKEAIGNLNAIYLAR